MNSLKLPEELKGAWENLLIVTYGADLPFFENTLLRQLRASCRNRIILADGNRYLEGCEKYAQAKFVRHLNQSYVAEGVWGTRAAHGKLILLTGPTEGKLFVGSGNLSLQGYASGGELFTSYHYAGDSTEDRTAFLDVFDLIDRLANRGWIQGRVLKHIRHLREKTQWLYGAAEEGHHPIRHNLDASFLDQLRAETAGAPVEELWVMAPFYDEALQALGSLIETLRPRETTLLIQPAACSVDPEALQDLIREPAGRCRILAVEKEHNPYLHAKLYLVKLRDRAICLQGSPNCSQAAMLLKPPGGNLEVANLLTGERDSFDYLLDSLSLTPVLSAELLDVSYHSDDRPEPEEPDALKLIGGEFKGKALVLRYRGTPPDISDLFAVTGATAVPLKQMDNAQQKLTFRIPELVQAALAHSVPVRLRWKVDGEELRSNAIFICNEAALDAELRETSDPESLKGVGDLDLDDEELEHLLAELEASLPIDEHDVWRMAGIDEKETAADGDKEGPHIPYEDIDYEMVRQHPRIVQYYRSKGGTSQYGRTRLQIILSSITDHFQGLLDATTQTGSLLSVPDSELDPEDVDGEAIEEEHPKRHWSTSARARNILKRFIRRYLRGLRSPKFHELVGHAVVSQNHIIFTYILWRLLDIERVEAEFAVDALLQTAEFFWGSAEERGYFAGLTSERQEQVLDWIREYYCDASMLACLYHGTLLFPSVSNDLRCRLRDFWRAFLTEKPFTITPQILEDVWRIEGKLSPYDPPRPSEIVDALVELAWSATDGEILDTLETRFGYPPMSLRFGQADIYGHRDPVKCLTMRPPQSLTTVERACAVIQAWRRLERMAYYRAESFETDCLILYDAADDICMYRGPEGKVIPVPDFALTPNPWERRLEELRQTAQELEQQIGEGFDRVRGRRKRSELASVDETARG